MMNEKRERMNSSKNFESYNLNGLLLKMYILQRLELLQLEEAQLNEVKERERIARELSDEQRLSSSFVELLNEHQLFDSMWTEDADGAILMMIGEEALNLKEEYV